MPRTVEDLLRSGATECKVGSKRKVHGKTITWVIKGGKADGTICSITIPPEKKVREARRKYNDWAKRRREVQGEVQDGYTCQFLYEGRL